MRAWAAMFALYLVGCQGGSPAAPPPPSPAEADSTAAVRSTDQLLARYRLAIDAEALTAEVTPVRVATAQGDQFDLDLATFAEELFSVERVDLSEKGTLRVVYRHTHPLPAPDLDQPPSATNRADLGYTGRLFILADREHRSYYGGEALLDPSLVVNPDAFASVGELLVTEASPANTIFPYRLLVADQYYPGPQENGSGWNAETLGPQGIGWRGFGFLHAGQSVVNVMELEPSALAESGGVIEVAILIQYTDPLRERNRNERLPPIPPDVDRFQYVLPGAALDVAQVWVQGEPVRFVESSEWTQIVPVRVWDWDWSTARVELDLPELGWETPLVFEGALSPDPPLKLLDQPVTVQPEYYASRSVRGLLRVTDDENVGTTRVGRDPITGEVRPGLGLPLQSYQFVQVEVMRSLPPITGMLPAGELAGVWGEEVTFEAVMVRDAEEYEWTFQFPDSPPVQRTEARPAIVLSELGLFTGTVRAFDSVVPSDPFERSATFAYSIAPNPNAPRIAARVAPGCVGDVVEGEILAGTDATSAHWSVERGLEPSEADGLTIPFTLTKRGVNRVHVRGENASGPGPSDDLFVVTERAEPYCWASHLVTREVGFQPIRQAGLILQGRPAMFYTEDSQDTETLWFARGLVPFPSQMRDWEIVPVRNSIDRRYLTEAIAIDGHPSVICQNWRGEGEYVRSVSEAPIRLEDWLAIPFPDSRYLPSLTNHEGHPFVAYVTPYPNSTAWVAESSIPLPVDPADWILTLVEQENAGVQSVASNDGTVLLAGFVDSDLTVTRRSSGSSSWVRYVLVPNNPFSDRELRPRAVGGYALAYTIGQHDLWIATTEHSDPLDAGAWSHHWLADGLHDSAPVALGEAGGRLAVVYKTSSPGPFIARALVADPISEADWFTQRLTSEFYSPESFTLLGLEDRLLATYCWEDHSFGLRASWPMEAY